MKQAAVEERSSKTTYRFAHSVAGAARNVGADALAERASTLEQTVGSLSTAQITVEIEAMQTELDVFLSRLETLHRTDGAGGGGLGNGGLLASLR